MFTKQKFMRYYLDTPYKTTASACWDAIINALYEQGILSSNTLMCAMAQVRVEIGKAFSPVRENLTYSSKDLMRIFPKYFTPQEAVEFAYQGERIANRVYANRYGNGDEASGDGYRYRGANLLQHTFKNNWAEVGITGENCMDLAVGARALAIYFKNRKVHVYADKGDWLTCRKLVNGINSNTGLPNGYDEFISVIKQYQK